MGHAPNVLEWDLYQTLYPEAALNPRTPSRLKGAGGKGKHQKATPMNRQDGMSAWARVSSCV
jgi:hypothetical protein